MSNAPERLADATWRKSSYSQNGGNCVEVATNLGRTVAVRDSKNPEGPALVVPTGVWGSFIAEAARRG